MKRCIAVFGPTASGKTSLAITLAKELNGVIISADSMQIYRGMDLATAKPTRQEQSEAPHRLIGILSPKETFSVYDYKRLAEEEIGHAVEMGKVPIVVGGTGLYFDALFFNTDFGEMPNRPEVRKSLEERADREGCQALLQELAKLDPESAAPLHLRDRKRILRALEVYYVTGKTLTAFKKESHRAPSDIQYCKLFLQYADRETLYRRIDQRVDQMLREGLLEETRRLLDEGDLSGRTAAQAIGYKEMIPFLRGEKELAQCTEILKQKTRNYAKRQITWFRRYSDAKVILMDREENPVETALREAKEFLRR